ncbi:hypothetical protein UT300012_21650 [Paraclostridium bifermentans]
MSYILNMREFQELITRHNKDMDDYKLVLDENFSNEVFENFSAFPGVLALPYVVENKMMTLYYVTELGLIPYLEKEIDIISQKESVVKISKNEVLELFKKKLTIGQKIIYPRSFISDLKYMVEKNFIENSSYVKAFKAKGHCYNRITKIVNKYPVDMLFIDKSSGDLIVKKNDTNNIKHRYASDYIFEYKQDTLIFNVLPGEPVMTLTDIQRLYDSYLVRLDSIYSTRYIQEDKSRTFKDELEVIMKSIVDLYTLTSRFNVKHVLAQALGSIESGKHFRQLKMQSNHLILMMLEYKDYLKPIQVHDNILKLVKKDLGTQRLVKRVDSHEVDLNTLGEFRGFLYRVNRDRNDIVTVIDTDLSMARYDITIDRSDVIPYVVYLKGDNKLVIAYECFNNEIATELRKPIAENKSRLSWVDIRKIATKSFKYTDRCLFRPMVYKTYKYLHMAGKLKDDDLLIKGCTVIIKNMRDLLMVVPLNNIVSKNDYLYLKIPGCYKIKNIKYHMRYDEKECKYYTIVKYPLKSWEYIDTMINCLEYEYDFCVRPEFNTACNVMLKETLEKIEVGKNTNGRVTTLKKMYIDCKESRLKNDLVSVMDGYSKGKKYNPVVTKFLGLMECTYVK